MSRFSRRDALKLGLLALGGLAARPLPAAPASRGRGFALGRVAQPQIWAYAQPDFAAERLKALYKDHLLTLFEEITAPAPAHNPLWYRTLWGWVHSGRVQKVPFLPPNPVLRRLTTPRLAEVTAPFTRAYDTARGGWQPLYRLYFASLHWIDRIETGPDGLPWYHIQEHFPDLDYFVPAADLRPLDPAEFAPLVFDHPGDRRIEISIESQTLQAYQGDTLLLATTVSTGLPDPPDLAPADLPTATPTGSFWVQTKMPARHMGDRRRTSDLSAYELPGVPWTMIFHEHGYGLHGCYWHNNFGVRMSHGCVNLRTADALWLFRWSDPLYDPSDWYKRERGTLVHVF